MAKDLIDKISPHTKKKIEYVTEYLENWLHVVCRVPNTKVINFIDCMCNAGEYRDSKTEETIQGTCTLALKIINDFAKNSSFSHIKFNLYLNDYWDKRIEYVENKLKSVDNLSENFNLHFDSLDVNNYVDKLSNKVIWTDRNEKQFTLLYVDPYNVGSVKIETLKTFLNKNYAELLYNFYANDFTRNTSKGAEKNQGKIKNAFAPIIKPQENIIDLKEEEICIRLANYFKIRTNVNYVFRYPFKNSKNAKLYYIMFATPNQKGLGKLKDALWKVFNGEEYYIYSAKERGQISFFNESDSRKMTLEKHVVRAKSQILEFFKNKSVCYNDILEYTLEYTMLKDGQLIDNILRPLVKEETIKKSSKGNKYIGEIFTF